MPDLIEVITPASSRPGGRHEHLSAHVGQIAIKAWRGARADGAGNEPSGVGWRRGEEWIPYMQRNFVTPPFPGYTSGHSTFSRAAAEVLAAVTGTPFFPGGLETFVAAAGRVRLVEKGPSATVELQWATYYDAADQAGVAGGSAGSIPSTTTIPPGSAAQIGQKAWTKAVQLHDGGLGPGNVSADVVPH